MDVGLKRLIKLLTQLEEMSGLASNEYDELEELLKIELNKVIENNEFYKEIERTGIIPNEIPTASQMYTLGEEVEIIANCPFNGMKGELAYVSEESMQIEVSINNFIKEGQEGFSYYRGNATDIKKTKEG